MKTVRYCNQNGTCRYKFEVMYKETYALEYRAAFKKLVKKTKNLTNLVFSNHDLSDMTIRNLNLSKATFRGCDLQNTQFINCNITDTEFRNCELRGSKFTKPTGKPYSLSGSDVDADSDILLLSRLLPPKGTEIIGWKRLSDQRFAKLLIPADASRTQALSRKCRASKARVLEIFERNGNTYRSGRSRHSPSFIYRTGGSVEPLGRFNPNWREECTSGIHFFVTKQEAFDY